MRKGQKKKKDVLTVRDTGQVQFWEGEESPCFKEASHSLIDQCFTRDPRLKNVRIHRRVMQDPDTLAMYVSYELSMSDPAVIEVAPLQIHPDKMPNVYTGQEAPNEIPNDRVLSEPVMGQTENA